MWKSPAVLFAASLAAALLVAALAPLESTLGANARIVYLHGAWVWTAMLAFLAAGLAGLAGLLLKRERLHNWSLALGRTGLFFWLTFLPMSLYVMQANWNGLFLDEPRFRVPLNFAVAGLLLQLGMAFFPAAWASAGNLLYAGALFAGMRGIDTVLHPDSPIFNSEARDIQIFFIGVLVFLLAAAWQMARWWAARQARAEIHRPAGIGA